MLWEKINFFTILFSVLFIVIAFSYAGDSDFELSVKGISVGIEDLQVLHTEHFSRHVISWTSLLSSWCILMGFFSSYLASWKSACDPASSYSCRSSCGRSVSLLPQQTGKLKLKFLYV